MNRSIDFFDRQFQRQVAANEFALNRFETLALAHVHGDVLDLGCGLGNFAMAAARAGCRVQALDASAAAIASLRERAANESLPVDAAVVDALQFAPARNYDAVICIGLLMFLPCDAAERLLARLQAAVRPGGMMVVNVLIIGTTYLDMFSPGGYCLFEPEQVSAWFASWQIVACEDANFDAPNDTLKKFRTIVARKPVDTQGERR